MKLIEKYRGYQVKAFTKRDGVEDHKIGSFVVITPDGIEDWEADTVKECKQFIDSKKGSPPAIKLKLNERTMVMLLCEQKLHDIKCSREEGRAIELHKQTLNDIIVKMGGSAV